MVEAIVSFFLFSSYFIPILFNVFLIIRLKPILSLSRLGSSDCAVMFQKLFNLMFL